MVHMTPFQQLQIRFLHARFPPISGSEEFPLNTRVTTGHEGLFRKRMHGTETIRVTFLFNARNISGFPLFGGLLSQQGNRDMAFKEQSTVQSARAKTEISRAWILQSHVFPRSGFIHTFYVHLHT